MLVAVGLVCGLTAGTMLECLMLSNWNTLSGPQLEEQLLDRISFRKFVGLSCTDNTPDETTFVCFCKWLREAGLRVRGVIDGIC